MIQRLSGGRCRLRSEIKRRPPSISARVDPSPGCLHSRLARILLAAEPFAEGSASAPAPSYQDRPSFGSSAGAQDPT
jgi:hypothetical protein